MASFNLGPGSGIFRSAQMMSRAAALTLLATISLVTPASAATLGPHAGLCDARKPAVLARVTGLKSASGTVTVKLYASNSKFLDRSASLRKADVAVTGIGPLDVCVPVPSSGRYVISVRHQVGPQKSRVDGAGLSGNPKISLVDVTLRRKPDLEKVSFNVQGSTTLVPIRVQYLADGFLAAVR